MGITYIGCPTHNGSVRMETHATLMTPSRRIPSTQRTISGSLLAHNFNLLLCSALNARPDVTHFALVHADVAAPPDWLDILHGEMLATGAHAVSAVVPMKGAEGLTSTAIDTPDTGCQRQRRLTMTEIVERFPWTFTAADIPADYPQGALLPNTGMLLMRLDDGRFDAFPGFTVNDRLYRDETGKYRCEVEPEDWAFGRWCAANDLVVAVTRKVHVEHLGAVDALPNDVVWGEWARDLSWFAPQPIDAASIVA